MQEEMFRLCKNDNIYIYGAGVIGYNLSRALRRCGYIVCSYIDQCVSQSDLPTMTLDEYLQKADEKDTVLITLNNGLAHDDIAAKINLFRGVERILFLPLKANISQKRRQQYRFSYIEIVNHHQFDVDIPKYHVDNANHFIIRNDYREYISFLFPARHLYSGKKKGKEGYIEIEREQALSRYYFKSAFVFRPYMELFDCLKNQDYDEEKLNEYMLISGRTTQESKKRLLMDRIDLYGVYSDALKKDISFFWDMPIQCIYENDKVYIIDGYHRYFFLLTQGLEEVPIILKKSEYELMKNDNKI